MKNSINEKLEKGQQLGKSFSFDLDGKSVWSSVGIQKWKGLYKVYIDEIFEIDIAAEIYQKELIRNFSELDEAIVFIKENSRATFQELGPLKGQRVFNPAFD